MTSHNTPSPAQLAANRANAQLSTGPASEAGRLVSSQNALKTGLTGRTVLLPTDDLAAYQSLLDGLLSQYSPANPEERELVQSVVDIAWRLQRIQNIEFGIFTKGSLEFADQFAHLEPAARNQMIQVETYLKYEKSIRNLNTQEARLQRQRTKGIAELQRVQAERASAPVGFEFSNTVPATRPIGTETAEQPLIIVLPADSEVNLNRTATAMERPPVNPLA